MRLIIVTASHCNVRPRDLPFSPNQREHALETEDPGEHLRREANIRGKHFDEAAGTEPDTGGDPTDRLHVGHGLNLAGPQDHPRMPPRGRGPPAEGAPFPG